MKTISGKIVSTKPVSLSKAANILSNFVTSDNGASQPVAAYLRRASAAFNELAYLKKHHRQKKSVLKEEADISHRSLEDDVNRTTEVEGKLRKKEKKKKKTEGSLGNGENDNIEVGYKEGDEKNEEKKKKKKKRKNAEVDGGEVGNSATPERKKRRRTEADD